MHGRIVILSGIILRVLQQGLKETMTVVTEIKTNGVLVYGMSRGGEFAKWGTQPFVSIVGVDSIVSDCSSWEDRVGIAIIAVVQDPECYKVLNVIEAMTGKQTADIREVGEGST